MMGSRGKLDGASWDAFSRWSRQIVPWRRGALRAIKRRFWKRDRSAAKRVARTQQCDI